jgi:hypothetical protein
VQRKKKNKARRAEHAPNRTPKVRLTARLERKPTKFFFSPSALATRPSKATYRQSQRSAITCSLRLQGANFVVFHMITYGLCPVFKFELLFVVLVEFKKLAVVLKYKFERIKQRLDFFFF